jgi:two-component system cell cycle response regulator
MSSFLHNLRTSIYEQVCKDFELLHLLDLLGEQLEKIQDIDDYVMNFLDDKRENLLSLKLKFVDGEFKPLEKTYFKYKVELSDFVNINARAYKESRILTINHQTVSPVDQKWLQMWKVDQISSIPFKCKDRHGEPLGTLLITKKHGAIQRSTFETIEELMEIFCPILDKAVAYFYLQEHSREFQDANEEQNRFLKFIGEISNLTELQEIYTLFSTELAHQLPFELAAYYLLEGDKLVGKNVTVTSENYSAKYDDWSKSVVDIPYATDNPANPISHTFVLDRHLLFEDVQKIIEISDSQPVEEKQPISENMHVKERRALLKDGRTALLVPIRHQHKPIGVCALYTLSSAVTVSEADLRLVEHLCTFLGAALFNGKNFAIQSEQHKEIVRLNALLQGRVSELSEQASTDQLTGLYNFRTFKSEIARRLQASKSSPLQNDLAIAIVDIDHFKKFNDTYGHAAGNVVLAGVAGEINKLVRKMDLACRYGGEEFVVMLGSCSIDGIKNFSDRMRTVIEGAKFVVDGTALSVTVSVGCTTNMPEDSPESFFERADQALYQAKHNGRNRVEVKV